MTRWLDGQFLKKTVVDVLQLVLLCPYMPFHVVKVSFICWLFYKTRKSTKTTVNSNSIVLAKVSRNKIRRSSEKLDFVENEVVHKSPDENIIQFITPGDSFATCIVPENINNKCGICECESQEIGGHVEKGQPHSSIVQINIIVESVSENRHHRKDKSLYKVSVNVDDAQDDERTFQTVSRSDIVARSFVGESITISTKRSEEADICSKKDDVEEEQVNGLFRRKSIQHINIIGDRGSETSSIKSRSFVSSVDEPQNVIAEVEGECPGRAINETNTRAQCVSDIYGDTSSGTDSEIFRSGNHGLVDETDGNITTRRQLSLCSASEDVCISSEGRTDFERAGGSVDDGVRGSVQLPDIALHGSCSVSPSGNIVDTAILLGLAQVELKKEQSLNFKLRRRIAELEETMDSLTSTALSSELEKMSLEERLRDAEYMLEASRQEMDDLRRQLDACMVVSELKETSLLSVVEDLEDTVTELHLEITFRHSMWDADEMLEQDHQLASKVENTLRSSCISTNNPAS